MASNNPFETEFEDEVKIAGMSSTDMQRRIHVLSERTKYLLDLLNKQSKDIGELKEMKLNARKSRAKKVVAEAE